MNVSDGQLLLLAPARPLAARLGADFFRAAPERPGVYLMSAARDGVLYVGKAKNLRRRLASHGSAASDRLPSKLRRLLSRVERIDWDECADEAAAIVRERDLIRVLRPQFNTVGVRAPRQWFIGWRRRGDSLELALDEAAPGWPTDRGPFAFARPAFAALLRSCWLVLHPDVSVTQLPSQLLTPSPPARWKFDWNNVLDPWLAELDALLEGRESRLLPTLPTAAPKLPQTFDEQWRTMDTECIAEFHGRVTKG